MPSCEVRTIIVDTVQEAREVVDRMGLLIREYGAVTVSDFYELCGLNPIHTDVGFGWTAIPRDCIKNVGPNAWTFSFGEPVDLAMKTARPSDVNPMLFCYDPKTRSLFELKNMWFPEMAEKMPERIFFYAELAPAEV